MPSKKQEKQKRRQKRLEKKRRPPSSAKLFAGLGEAMELLSLGHSAEAEAVLEELAEAYPNRVEPLDELLRLHLQQNQDQNFCLTARRLKALRPEDVSAAACLAAAYSQLFMPFQCLQAHHEIVERWPDSQEAEHSRGLIQLLEAEAPKLLQEAGLPGPDGPELACRHEELRLLTEAGEIEAAHRVAEELLGRRPDFIPALNNLSLLLAREGKLDEACSKAQRVLALCPTNFHALGNLVRFHLLRGQVEEARAAAEQLKRLESSHHDFWVKKAEALSFLGDDQGVLDALAGAEASPRWKPLPPDAFLYHLAAVAQARLGRPKEACGLWKKALKLNRSLSMAQENLADAELPVGIGQGAWAFPVHHWLPGGIAKNLKDAVPVGKGGAFQQHRFDSFLEAHPEVVHLVPVLLDRGDPPGRTLVLLLAQLTERPDILGCLREFAFGQRGSDQQRIDAALRLCRAGLLPSGMHRLWREGRWQDSLLMGWQIDWEPADKHPVRVRDLMVPAMEALGRGDGKEGERLLKQALLLAPDAPDILNNLAAAYNLQRRYAESDALIRQIHERHPDYLFGRTNLALMCVKEGDLARARELLQPVLERTRFHFTEFAALSMAEIELRLAEGNREAAKSWFDMWESSDPDHPQLEVMRRRLRPEGWLARLFR